MTGGLKNHRKVHNDSNKDQSTYSNINFMLTDNQTEHVSMIP